MSLEQAVQENTTALRELIVLLTLQNKNAVLTFTKGVEEKQGAHSGESAVSQKVTATDIGKAAAATGKAKAAEVAKTEEKPDATKPPNVIDRVWTYQELADDFLLLVKSDREKALALLASLGASTLKDFKEQPAFFPAIAAKLWEARNG